MFGSAPGWADSGKPGPKSQARRTVAPLPDDPPTGLSQAERTHWLELREQLRTLGTACAADTGLVRMLSKQMARLEMLQAVLRTQGPVRADGTPSPLLKAIESLERTCAVNLNSLDLSPVRRRGADAVMVGVEALAPIARSEWVWDPGLREVLATEDVEALEAYKFPREILGGHLPNLDEAEDDKIGTHYRVSFLCKMADKLERVGNPLMRLLGDFDGVGDPFAGNPTPDIVSWIAAASDEVKRGEFAGVLEAYQD
jgi:hypothetical protein